MLPKVNLNRKDACEITKLHLAGESIKKCLDNVDRRSLK